MYWQYQLAIKQSEAALGAPMGVHGAFYLFRRELFAPLPLDTINDDFILPMEIVAQGYHARYDTQIMALELEPTSEALERSRRRRIAAGNLQQTLRLAHLLHPRHGGIALLFGSGKALRALMPFILLFTFFASGYLAIDYPYWRLFFALQVALYGLVAFLQLEPALAKKPLMQTLQYLVLGHLNGLIGSWYFITGRYRQVWQLTRNHKETVR
ncbi:glycosyltransferase [Pseudobowmanella zhangzhouensis]|uniref:glycosyltransferase family 2 protein n=1 Tax=Pseudobowmanella zhangzhouensis TaxID=1537679 RepID=UPI00361BF8E9